MTRHALASASLTSPPTLPPLLFQLQPHQPPSCSLTSFSPGSLQGCCFLCLEYSSPLYNAPPKGRDQSRTIFCFKLLGPVSASCQMHMEQMGNQACPLLVVHTLHPEPLTLTERNRECQHSSSCKLLFTLPVSVQQDEGNEDYRSSQLWWHQMLAIWERTSPTGMTFVCVLLIFAHRPLQLEFQCPHPCK